MAQAPAPQDISAAPAIPAEHISAKERIVAAAIRLFVVHGYEATSVREIVEAAGVTKPVLYYYFKNKEDLFQQIVVESNQRFLRQLRQVCEREFQSIEQPLRAILSIFMDAAKNAPDLVRLMHATAHSGMYNEMFDFEGFRQEFLDIMAHIFEQAVDQGQVRSDVDPRALALHFIGVCANSMVLVVFCPMKDSACQTDPIQLVLEGFMPRKPTGAVRA